MKLLSREQFRTLTLHRFKGICCASECTKEAVDAHHILNRNLYSQPDEFGGYFLENGAGLCSTHHYQAELTLITVEQLREDCKIVTPSIPSPLDKSKIYDCWGNEIVNAYTRLPGLLFHDEGCQKALTKAGVLWQFPFSEDS